MEIVVVSTGRVLGALAKYAVLQSPYLVPEELGTALRKVAAYMDAHFGEEVYTEIGLYEMQNRLVELFRRTPEIAAWNVPKSGHTQHVAVSRYSKPSPDDDFIDLDALARNVVRDIMQDDMELVNQHP